MSLPRSAFQIVRPAFILVALLMLAVSPALAYFGPATGEAATLVLGQANFTSNVSTATQTGMAGPEGVAVDPLTHKVFVADYYNNRVLRFGSILSLSSGAPAQAVFGQATFTGHASHLSQTGLFGPVGISVDAAGRLWVADANNNRVLRFDHASTLASGAGASAVLGQTDFVHATTAAAQNGMNYPLGVFADAGGRVWVSDDGNSRVLRFDNAAAKANGANADGELGQPNFTTGAYTTSQSGMYYPDGLTVDAGGHLWVADYSNNRVLRFDSAASKSNGANADGVLGQSVFSSGVGYTTQAGMYRPAGLAVDNATGRLYVADETNSRVVIFNAAAGLANGANANYVIGQKNFTTGTVGTTATTLWMPDGVFFDPYARVLLVGDTQNGRVLMYGKASRHFSVTSAPAVDGWVRESAETSNKGGSISAAGTLRLGDDSANKQYRSVLSFDTSALPDTAAIHAVTITIVKAGVVGSDPLGSFGILLADIKNGSFGAPALQAGDFQSVASANSVAHFSPLLLSPGAFQLTLPAAYYGDIDRVGITQFRLRFNLDDNNNHVADYDTFYAGDTANAAYRPVLSVEYTLP